MKFDVVIPTYKRPEKLKRCLRSLVSSTEFENIVVYVYFDNAGDTPTENFLSVLQEFDQPNIIASIVKKQYKAFGVWNHHLKNLTSDGMFYICDDTALHEDCLEKAISELATNFLDTDGVIGINQENIAKGNEGFSVSAMGLIGRKFAERYPNNQVYCPDYTSFHADAELGIYARSVNRFRFCSEAKLFHWHPSHYKDEMDETHNVVRGDNKNVDKNTWSRRNAAKYLWGRDFKLVN